MSIEAFLAIVFLLIAAVFAAGMLIIIRQHRGKDHTKEFYKRHGLD